MKAIVNLCKPIVNYSKNILPQCCLYKNILISIFIVHKRQITFGQNNYNRISGVVSESEPINWGSKKQHRKIKLNFPITKDMYDSKTEEILAPLRQSVKEQV